MAIRDAAIEGRDLEEERQDALALQEYIARQEREREESAQLPAANGSGVLAVRPSPATLVLMQAGVDSPSLPAGEHIASLIREKQW